MDYNDLKVKEAAQMVQSFVSINNKLIAYTRRNAESLGLTLTQMGILNSIYSFSSITFKELTDKILIPKSTLSVSLDELVNLGLVKRVENQNDRRKINLILTDKGKELSRKSIENSSSYIAMFKALEKLSPEEIKSLFDIHKKLLELL